MKILHLIPSISPLRGGPSQAVLAMVAVLRQRGLEARILTTNGDGPGELTELPLGVWHERQGVPVLAFPRWSPPGRLLRPPSGVLRLRWTDPLARPPSSGVCPASPARPVFLPLHRRHGRGPTPGVPYVLRSIGQLNCWSLQQSPRRKRLRLRLIKRRNLEGAAAVHVTSEAERREVAALGLSKPSFVLTLGVDP